MAKRKPKHHAPVAATKSDINGGLARIIELAAKWRAIGQWTQTLNAAKWFRRDHNELMTLTEMIHHDDRRLPTILDGKKLSRSERIAIQKKDEAKYGQMWDDAREYQESCEFWSGQVADAERELQELQDLVMQHIPQLLECVPDVDFIGGRPGFGEGFCLNPPEVDHSPLRRDLRKLEGQAQVLTLGVKAVDQPMQSDTTVAHKGISLLDAALPTPGDEAGDRRAGMNGDSDEKDPEPQHPFGMKIDEETRTVKRFNPGINKETFCTISNDEQWNLFMLVKKRSGRVAAKEVQVLLPLQTVRDRTVSRLRGRLQEIQLTIRHQKGTGYVLTEI